MDYLVKYGFSATAESVAAALGQISAKLPEKPSSEVLKACFAAMDLTTLRTNDTVAVVEALVDKANRVGDEFPGCPLPASVCVYPNFASTVRGYRRNPELHVTTVAGCFPSSQSYLEVKVMECRLAVRNGADEVDIVLALDPFLSGDYAAAAAEISEMRKAIDEEGAAAGRKVVLKVILETGLLASVERIAAASFLAMEAGADFIKTSTGKVSVNATPAAAYVMCECISRYYAATGRKVGFKPAGGISSAMDAVSYYSIVSAVLGKGWLTKDFFRLGVSRLANNILSEVRNMTVS